MPKKKENNKLSALLKKKGISIAKNGIEIPNAEEMLSDLEQTRLELVKKHGERSVIYASELLNLNYGRISTGNFALDVATGGGVPIGRVTSCSGEYSVGKSLVLYHTIAHAQRMGLRCQLEDVEGTYDPDWAEQCGIDNSKLLLVQPGGAEEALQIAVDSQRRKIDFIGIDSVEALAPAKEMEHEFEDTMQMGIKQKMLGEYLRKFTAINNLRRRYGNTPLTVFLINQLREKPTMFGNLEIA